MSQFQPPQFQQFPPQFPPRGQSKKNLALYMFIASWVAGFLGFIFTTSILGACIGLPLLVAALVTHILGFVFLAQIRECP
jgi:hypothetical protein